MTVGCGVERLAAAQAAGPAVHIRLSERLPGESPVGGAPPRALVAVVGGRWGVCAPSRCASVAQSRLPERCARARALGSVRPCALAGDAAVPAGGLGRDASRRPSPVSSAPLERAEEAFREDSRKASLLPYPTVSSRQRCGSWCITWPSHADLVVPRSGLLVGSGPVRPAPVGRVPRCCRARQLPG